MASTNPPDGGPIYPCNSPVHKGMSLRDWLAGQALAGFTRVRDAEMFNEHTTRWYARVAYSLADAMLVERTECRARELEGAQHPMPYVGDLHKIAVPAAGQRPMAAAH